MTPTWPCSTILIAVVDDDADDDGGGIRLMGTRWSALGSSNQRCPPSPLLYSPLITGPRWLLTLVMSLNVCVLGGGGGGDHRVVHTTSPRQETHFETAHTGSVLQH